MSGLKDLEEKEREGLGWEVGLHWDKKTLI